MTLPIIIEYDLRSFGLPLPQHKFEINSPDGVVDGVYRLDSNGKLWRRTNATAEEEAVGFSGDREISMVQSEGRLATWKLTFEAGKLKGTSGPHYRLMPRQA